MGLKGAVQAEQARVDTVLSLSAVREPSPERQEKPDAVAAAWLDRSDPAARLLIQANESFQPQRKMMAMQSDESSPKANGSRACGA
jgi:hypothetical protein